ncbi:MAG: hypothetical protein MJ202_06280 [Lentisphaeria bacterium]|nr:hypothetical protein [Lentisphaeria bacterium]
MSKYNDLIVDSYEFLKNIGTWEELVEHLRSWGMPELKQEIPETYSQFERCDILGQWWARFLFASNGIPRPRVSKIAFEGESRCFADLFYSVLITGDVKTLYLMKQDAIDFINHTALQKIDEDFLKSSFCKPVVLFAGTPQKLFDEVTSVQVVDMEDGMLSLLYAFMDNTGQSRIIGKEFEYVEILDMLSRDRMAAHEEESGTRYMLEHNIIDDAGKLDENSYKALSLVFKFVLLSQCEKQPLEISNLYRKASNPEKARKTLGKLRPQRVSLTTVYRSAMNRFSHSNDTISLDKEGKVLRVTEVRGFIRRQHYGPGNSLVKSVFIEAHQSHAWMKEGIRIITVVK